MNHCQSVMIHPCLKLPTFLNFVLVESHIKLFFFVFLLVVFFLFCFFHLLLSIWVNAVRVGGPSPLWNGAVFYITIHIKKNPLRLKRTELAPLDNFALFNPKLVGLFPLSPPPPSLLKIKRLRGEYLRTIRTINICRMTFKDAKLK